jgi:polyhydroxyalkanoate synthesis regulator phasin
MKTIAIFRSKTDGKIVKIEFPRRIPDDEIIKKYNDDVNKEETVELKELNELEEFLYDLQDNVRLATRYEIKEIRDSLDNVESALQTLEERFEEEDE